MKTLSKKEHKENKIKKVLYQKEPVIQVGTNKKIVIILWCILILSVVFGIYKNFTAIDKHTVHEKKVIQEKMTDTNAVENFVLSYAKVYFEWKPDAAVLDERLKKLETYTSADLRKINEESIREDIPTTSWVEEAKIWSIEKSSKKDYRVEFSVKQKIQEGDKKEKYESFYITNVHKDANGAMVVTQNPTVCGGYSKSNYEKKVTVNDGSVDNNEQLEIEEFLVTFFRLYPTADEKELSYYAEKNVLKPIQEKNDVYVLSEVEIVSAVKEKKITYVQVNVTYLDQQTKAMQISQYDLKLKKEGNWKIVK